MEPAYLDSAEVESVVVEVTTALTINCKHNRHNYLPLRQLSRIVVMGEIQWSTAALTACMRAEIPIMFMNRRGGLLGVCSTLAQRKQGMHKMLKTLLDLPDCRNRMDNWTRSQQARQRWLFCKACGFSLNDLPPAQAHTAALDTLSVHLGYNAARLEKVLHSQLAAALYDWLAEQGYSHDILQGHDIRLPLIDSYQHALVWYLRSLLYKSPPNKKQLEDELLRTATHWFHQHNDPVRKHVTKLHASLYAWCVGELVR